MMYKDLSHLTDAEINTLIGRYYSSESAQKLIQEYDLSVRPSGLYKLFPPEVYENYLCEYCDVALVTARRSKTYNHLPKREEDLFCPVCGHRPYYSGCKCNNCVREAAQIEAEQKGQISACYSKSRTPVAFSALSFEGKVFLGALCRALLKENLYEISPYENSDVVIAPSSNLCYELYNTLIREEAIVVSPLSSLSAFDTDADNFPYTFYPYNATYNLNLQFPPNKQDLFTEILNPSYYSSEFSLEALSLWKKIAIAECIEYLQYQLASVGFTFSPGEKTHKTFEIILNNFSISQIYGIIWKSVADASKLYLEKGLAKKHAANSVIGACERYAERAKINHWDLVSYHRVRDLPQSALSLFFFNRVLSIGDMGFEVPPTIV